MAVTLLSLFLITDLYDIGLMNPCPSTNASIEERTHALTCTGPNKYHCFCGPNGEAVEVCAVSKFIEKEECVIGYTKTIVSNAVNFSKVNCNGSDCPKLEYLSHEVYKYGSCRNLSTENKSCISGKRTTTLETSIYNKHTTTETTIKPPHGNQVICRSLMQLVINGVLIVLVAINSCILSLVCARRKISMVAY